METENGNFEAQAVRPFRDAIIRLDEQRRARCSRWGCEDIFGGRGSLEVFAIDGFKTRKSSEAAGRRHQCSCWQPGPLKHSMATQRRRLDV